MRTHTFSVATVVFVLVTLDHIHSHGYYDYGGYERMYIRYSDIVNQPMEPFFDRLVAISLNLEHHRTMYYSEYLNIAVGVMVDRSHVLSSYNPFRRMSKMPDIKDRIRIIALMSRNVVRPEHFMKYYSQKMGVACARQVMPIRENALTKDQWFGTNHKHSPVHDLMVFRVHGNVNFRKPEDLYDFREAYKEPRIQNLSHYYMLHAGPLKTTLAKPGEQLGRRIMFGSIAFVNDKHMYQTYYIKFKKYNPEDNVVVDCDEWLPRDWGHFICVRNVDNYPALGSSAVLVYKDVVFGIGSFMLERANISIFAFTDVRPYYHLIMGTCTWNDRHLGK